MSDSDLIEIERKFWLEGGDFFDENAASDTVWVMPKAHGILDHGEARDKIDREGRWDDVEFGDLRETKVDDEVTILTYEATGTKDGQEGEVVYRAQCSTVYRGRKLVHHHQTALS